MLIQFKFDLLNCPTIFQCVLFLYKKIMDQTNAQKQLKLTGSNKKRLHVLERRWHPPDEFAVLYKASIIPATNLNGKKWLWCWVNQLLKHQAWYVISSCNCLFDVFFPFSLS